jgi:hypothetical protein
MTFSPDNRTLARAGAGNGLYLLLLTYAKTFLTEEQQIDNVPGFDVTLHDPGKNLMSETDESCAFRFCFEYF